MTTKTLIMAAALAVLAPTAATADKPASRDEAVAACVKNREQAFACKEPFIDAMIDMRLRATGKTVPPEQKTKMREKGLAELAEDGSGPLAPRRAKCESVVDGMSERGTNVEPGTLARLDQCYAKKDCKARVACMMPILESFMFPKKN